MMKAERPVLEFEDDFLRRKVFNFADIPKAWHEGDFLAELDTYEILEALTESADFVEKDTFEDGMPGMSGTFYRVFAEDTERFRRELTTVLLKLLEHNFGKSPK